jgi:protease I
MNLSAQNRRARARYHIGPETKTLLLFPRAERRVLLFQASSTLCDRAAGNPPGRPPLLAVQPRQFKGDDRMAGINGVKVAILATDGVEQVELTEPQKALKEAGAQVMVVSPKGKTPGKIQGMNHDQKGDQISVDAELESVKPEQFDALVLPGGVANPDYLRVNKQAVAFVKAFGSAGKPIAAICHAPWTLIEADLVRGRKVTSWPSLQTDLRNAGANWVDETVVRDGMLVTSRKPDDLADFCRETIALFGETTRKAA